MLRITSYEEYKKLSETEKEIFKEIHKQKNFLMYALEQKPDYIDKYIDATVNGEYFKETKQMAQKVEEIITNDSNIKPIKEELKIEKAIFEMDRIEEELKINIEIGNIASFSEEYSSIYFLRKELEELGIKIEIEREVPDDEENEQEGYKVYKIILPKGHFSKDDKKYTRLTHIYNKYGEEVLYSYKEHRRSFTSIRKPD